jgi:hypothetical protein
LLHFQDGAGGPGSHLWAPLQQLPQQRQPAFEICGIAAMPFAVPDTAAGVMTLQLSGSIKPVTAPAAR